MTGTGTPASADVKRDFAVAPLVNYISGRFSDPSLAIGAEICDANTAAPLQAQFAASPDTVEVALASADACWKAGHYERDEILRVTALESIAAYLERPQVADEIGRSDALTTGIVIGSARKFARMLPLLFRQAAATLREGALRKTVPGPKGDIEYFRRPWGPALLISPWNGPTPIGGHKLASAIAAGAPAIIKPSVWTPHSAIHMVRAAHEAGLPEGAVSLIMGDRRHAQPMIEDQRVQCISFTGGLGGGRAIARACADHFRPLQAELGGNNALVVLEGADIAAAADGIVFGLANLNGQWCRALGRVMVHRPLRTKLVDAVLERLAVLRLGSSLSDQSQMGPQAHARQFQDLNNALDDLRQQGGAMHMATPLPSLDGYFAAPTLVSGLPLESTLHEIFGPVATLLEFDTESEALQLANAAPFGLAGYVFGPQAGALAFAREMRTGGVKVNGYSLLALNGDLPRGAWALSGLGEEGRRETIEFFTGARVVGVSPQDTLGA